MTTLPLKYDEACRAVAEARSFDEVREWENKAAAVKEYTRRIGNRSMELDSLEIRERARRRRGELLLELKGEGKLIVGREKVNGCGPFERITLDDLHISKNESARDQKIASIPTDSYERLIARCRAHLEQDPDRHSLDVLKAPSAHMAARVQEAGDLDYSPTPPWATRALCHHVMPELGYAGKTFTTVWEPACGAGHMAEVLAEYSDLVIATDLHSYGYGQAPLDFLGELPSQMSADWIITNPPFEDRVLKFMVRALELARIGVAMFLQLRYLEGIGRYNEVFKLRPPTIIAPFVERVPLLMGQYDPKASTTTAFMWLVWVHGAQPQAPFWIPPSCRESLTHADDNIRFTAHPVIRKENYNPSTGEIAA